MIILKWAIFIIPHLIFHPLEYNFRSVNRDFPDANLPVSIRTFPKSWSLSTSSYIPGRIEKEEFVGGLKKFLRNVFDSGLRFPDFQKSVYEIYGQRFTSLANLPNGNINIIYEMELGEIYSWKCFKFLDLELGKKERHFSFVRPIKIFLFKWVFQSNKWNPYSKFASKKKFIPRRKRYFARTPEVKDPNSEVWRWIQVFFRFAIFQNHKRLNNHNFKIENEKTVKNLSNQLHLLSSNCGVEKKT